MTNEIRNTHEAKDDEPERVDGYGMPQPEKRPPRYGEFLPERALADHLDHALPDVKIVRDHVRNPWKQRQAAALVAAMELLRDQLRTEHHT